MTLPITFSPPKELLKMWLDEQVRVSRNFVPTIKVLAVSVHQACIEIGRQWRIAQVQK